MKNKLLYRMPLVFYFILFLFQAVSCSKTGYQIIDRDDSMLAALHQNKSYVLGCGDTLKVTVWRHEETDADAVIMPDGKISLPLVGEVAAAGLTVDELKDELNRKYNEYITEPHITITVKETNSLKIYVLGEVTRPGELKLNSYTDVLQAISMAGGFTIYANRSTIHIIRKEGDKKIKINFNYNEVVAGKNLNQNIPLKPGDVIVVSESW
jgi:polysaccharide export outer membrane protein